MHPLNPQKIKHKFQPQTEQMGKQKPTFILSPIQLKNMPTVNRTKISLITPSKQPPKPCKQNPFKFFPLKFRKNPPLAAGILERKQGKESACDCPAAYLYTPATVCPMIHGWSMLGKQSFARGAHLKTPYKSICRLVGGEISAFGGERKD